MGMICGSMSICSTGVDHIYFFFSEDVLMNRLLIAIIAGAFALGPVAVMAQNMPPVQQSDTAVEGGSGRR
jgi:hypothetical protein